MFLQIHRSCPGTFHRVIHRYETQKNFLLLVAVILFDAVCQFRHLVVDGSAFLHEFADLLVGVHHRGVVAVAEQLADLGQRQIGELAAQVHGDLSGGGDGL